MSELGRESNCVFTMDVARWVATLFSSIQVLVTQKCTTSTLISNHCKYTSDFDETQNVFPFNPLAVYTKTSVGTCNNRTLKVVSYDTLTLSERIPLTCLIINNMKINCDFDTNYVYYKPFYINKTIHVTFENLRNLNITGSIYLHNSFSTALNTNKLFGMCPPLHTTKEIKKLSSIITSHIIPNRTICIHWRGEDFFHHGLKNMYLQNTTFVMNKVLQHTERKIDTVLQFCS